MTYGFNERYNMGRNVGVKYTCQNLLFRVVGFRLLLSLDLLRNTLRPSTPRYDIIYLKTITIKEAPYRLNAASSLLRSIGPGRNGCFKPLLFLCCVVSKSSSTSADCARGW